MKTKIICVVTSTRADYGYFRLILRKILNSKLLNLSLIVTGTHLLKKYGNTVNNIIKENIPITKKIKMYDEEAREDRQGEAIGKAIIKFTRALNEIKPDLLLVLGDRYEPLAAVIAASTLSIPIAHIHGGDNVSKGQVDEQIRHAITKFSHIHFPATEKSYKRIKLLGEETWRIHKVGSPSIDSIYLEKLLERYELSKKYGFEMSEKIILCIQHPYTFEANQAGKQMKITLNVLKEFNFQTIIVYPNNDPGSDMIIKEIGNCRNIPNFKIFKNLDYVEYLSFLKNADLLIGNSSSGIIESPIFKIPVVNIGNRNKGRETGENVINVPHDYEKIKNAILKGLSDKFKRLCDNVKNPYGDGKTSERIVKILEDLKIEKKLLIKKLAYEI